MHVHHDAGREREGFPNGDENLAADEQLVKVGAFALRVRGTVRAALPQSRRSTCGTSRSDCRAGQRESRAVTAQIKIHQSRTRQLAKTAGVHEAALPALSIYLSGLMYEAMRDLFHLNPHDGPSPREMFERFVAWGPFRRSILEGR